VKILYSAHIPFVLLFLLFVAGLLAVNWTNRRKTR